MKFIVNKSKTKKAGKKKNNKTKISIKRKIKVKSKKNNKKKAKKNTPKNMRFKDIDKENMQKPKLVLIYAEWCGHCQAMKPNWEEMKSDLINDNLYGPDDIIEIESNEQEEQLPKINHLVTNGSKINVNGYPTMGKIVDGGFKQYVGGRTTMELLNWANKNEY
tara:strand:+ start:452 stop:940 length:489 start_codon:yes stop_codon:yes gene_type:complete